MSALRFSQPALPARTAGQLKEAYKLLRISLRGKHIVCVTEGRYVENEGRLFERMAERLETKAEVVSYSHFMENPKSVKADILMLRTSKLFVVSFPEILDAIDSFRRANLQSAVIASVLDANAFEVLSSRPDLVNLIDSGAATNDHELLHKGAEVLERLS